MTDREDFDDLEREIAALNPKAMPPAILDRLTAEMSARPRSPWADRCLVGAIGTGLAASVVIASMLWIQSATPASPPVGGPMLADHNPQRAGDYLAAFARVDGNWGAGIVK